MWQESWESFVDLLTEYLQAGDEASALNARIAGKTITWTGFFESADLDEMAPNVYIGLPSRLIDFGDGRTATVDGISLPVAEGSQACWAGLKPGETIKFGAKLGRSNSPFPPVTVKSFRSGKTMVTLRLEDGVLVA